MADVLISGGGLAGSTLAILLGRRGLRVKEKTCGEGMMPAGVAVLNRELRPHELIELRRAMWEC